MKAIALSVVLLSLPIASPACSRETVAEPAHEFVEVTGPRFLRQSIEITISSIHSEPLFVSCALEALQDNGWREIWGSLHSQEPTKSTQVTEIQPGGIHVCSLKNAAGSALAEMIRRLGKGPYRIRVDVFLGRSASPATRKESAEFSVDWK